MGNVASIPAEGEVHAIPAKGRQPRSNPPHRPHLSLPHRPRSNLVCIISPIRV